MKSDVDTTCVCTEGYALQSDHTCQTVCGDGIFMAVNEECDDGNNNNNDGCSSICKPETDWSCSNQNFLKSTCGFQGSMSVVFQNVTKNPNANQITLTFSVGPTL